MVMRINRLLGSGHLFCVIGLILLSLVAFTGISGCSSSSGGGGGGGGKDDYHLKGYDGVLDGTTTQTLVSGVGNTSLKFYAPFPWYVNLTFQVLDKDLWGVPGLTVNDFTVMEDGAEVSKTDSEMNIRTRTKLPPGYAYTLKTILLLDNTPSNPIPLEKMIEAAQVVVDFIDEHKQQKIAVVAYDDAGDPTLIQDFTDNLTTLNTALINLKPSYGISNFYGAVRYCLSLYDDNPSPARTEESPDQTDFVQGFVVAVTDGLDTSNLYDVDDAIALRKDKQVITVAVGPDVSESTLSDLERLGNGGFYPVPRPDQPADEGGSTNPASENLCEWMKVVQERMLAYADAFYWLQYRSAATSKDAVKIHSVTLSVNGNRNDGADGKISGTYSSEDFFSGDTSIYFNATGADPDGITEKDIMIERGQGAGEVTETIVALTYDQTGASPSQYEWSSENTNIFTVRPNSSDSSKATITVTGTGEAYLIVRDTINDVTNKIRISVKIRQESFEMIRHMVTSQAPWFADATFQVRKTYDPDAYDEENPWRNQWEWVTDLAREDMTVMENGIQVDMESSALNLRKRDHIPTSYTYTLKTVLYIDNSPSIRTDELNWIKTAAKAFAKRALVNDPQDRTDLGPLLDANSDAYQQEIAVVSHTEEGETVLVQDFTTDLDTVNAAIDTIVRGKFPIDFYDGMLKSLRLWTTDHSPYDAGNDFVQGVVVVMSAGWDSANLTDRQAVLDETGAKQIICVSVGDDLVSENSEDLIAFGNAGFYSVPDPGNTTKVKVVSDNGITTRDVIYTDLELTLMGIQDVVYAYANSFYWLNYKSGLHATTCERRESMVITINNNNNTSTGKTVSGNFESCNFFDGIDGKIYVNQTVTNPDGIDAVDMQYVLLGNIPMSDPTVLLEAFTYDDPMDPQFVRNKPSYQWTIHDPSMVKVTPVSGSWGNSQARLSLPDVKRPGDVGLLIEDTVNRALENLDIHVSGLVLPAPIAWYPFNGNADDETGNGYDGTVSGATLTTDRNEKANSAYSFDGTSGAIALDLIYGDSGLPFNDLTVSVWIKTNSSKNGRIVSFDYRYYWELYMNDGFLYFSSIPYGDSNSMKTTARYNDGQWHHVAGTIDGDTGEMQIFVDGISVATDKIAISNVQGQTGPRQGFIGAREEPFGTNLVRFEGSIDSVLIFDQVLSADIIQQLAVVE